MKKATAAPVTGIAPDGNLATAPVSSLRLLLSVSSFHVVCEGARLCVRTGDTMKRRFSRLAFALGGRSWSPTFQVLRQGSAVLHFTSTSSHCTDLEKNPRGLQPEPFKMGVPKGLKAQTVQPCTG